MGSLLSCGGSKKAQKELLYLQGNLDTVPNLTVINKEVTIQKGDLLSIIVFSDNAAATVIYNQQQSSVGEVKAPSASGYLVDTRGNIHLQALGEITVSGLTREQLKELLVKKLTVYLQNPYVDIKFLNFRFTVIGEVMKPGTFTVPEERISVLEMLGLAGDLTVYGRRDNILIIREKEGKREFGRLDIRRPDVFQSPYFYLQQNDVVIVEPTPKKPTVNDQIAARNLTIATGVTAILSTIAIIYNIIK